MKRGTVVWVNLEDMHPPEFGKTRPCLVCSNSSQNELLDTVVVLPISSRAPEIWPLRIKLPSLLGKTSFVVIPGIRQIMKSRILSTIALCPEEFMSKVEEAMGIYLGDY